MKSREEEEESREEVQNEGKRRDRTHQVRMRDKSFYVHGGSEADTE